jgi:flavin-binding protein dodecin
MADESLQSNDGETTRSASSGDAAGPSKVVAIAGIALVVVVAAIALGIRLSGTSSTSADGAVRGALVSTLATNTANLAISESIDVEGQIGTAKGSGKCDLQSDACSATLVYNGALSQLGTESMVYSDRIMYLKLAGTVGASFPTPWISLPFKASNRPSALGSTGSPLAGLALLTRRGAVLKDEGMVKVDGATMHQYSVSVSKTSATSVVSRRESDLPTWLVNPATEGPLGALSMTLDVNAGGRIGRIKFTTSATQDGTYAIVHATETITGYGRPVTIAVPSKKQLTFVDALSGTLTRYCTPAPGLRLGPASKPIVTRH